MVRARQARFACAAAVLLLSGGGAAADETCQSPYLPKIVGQEAQYTP